MILELKGIYKEYQQGKIHAIVSCGDAPKFYVDPETGKLWEKKEEGKGRWLFRSWSVCCLVWL